MPKLVYWDISSEAQTVEFPFGAFYCNANGEKITNSFVIKQGNSVKVCVDIEDNEVVFIKKISDFTWSKDDGKSQLAINGDGVTADALTIVSCTPGSKNCFFETLLTITFFDSTGIVSGAGDVLLQLSENRVLLQTSEVGIKRNDQQQPNYNENGTSSTGFASIRVHEFQVISTDEAILDTYFKSSSGYIDSIMFSYWLFTSFLFFLI